MSPYTPNTSRYFVTTLMLLLMWLGFSSFTGSIDGNSCADGLCKGGDDNPELLSRVQRYLTSFHSYAPQAKNEVLFIVPYEGCPYCVEKVISFYINLQKDQQVEASDLILAGSGEEAAHAAPHFSDIQERIQHFDNKNMITRYGIGGVYPIAVYFESGEISKVQTMNAESMESVQGDVLSYLGS